MKNNIFVGQEKGREGPVSRLRLSMGAKRSPFPGQIESQENAKGANRNPQPVSCVTFP